MDFFASPASTIPIATANVTGGNSLNFDQNALELTAPTNNSEDIVVTSAGKEKVLAPGGLLLLAAPITNSVGGEILSTDVSSLCRWSIRQCKLDSPNGWSDNGRNRRLFCNKKDQEIVFAFIPTMMRSYNK